MAMSSSRGNGKSRKNLNYGKTFLMPGFWNGEITNWAVKSSVAIETLESNQSHYITLIVELTNWLGLGKIVSRNLKK
jgi:hypothetical protein